ncbi:sugar ABC transporter ATP-binding protein [Clostridiales bacterium COT073_COT-073]|nr:sugar ABC transporter ATP-binding protein [Clostridiales bacterium COT073_COT-073]
MKAENREDIILEFRNVTKDFPGVRALDNVSFSVRRGSVHVLCGENGAGKSTLMKIINGLYQATSGEILYNGKQLKAADPMQAREQGISMIYQELNIVPDMTIADNIYLGREIMKGRFFVDDKLLYQTAEKYMKDQGLNYNLKEKMKTLSVAQAQMIEIIKAISCNAKIILMDEPTSAITEKEVEYLFNKIEELKQAGVTIIYISHKMNEIFRVADYISVFRDGKHIETRQSDQFDVNQIIKLMVGREMKEVYPPANSVPGEEVFRVNNLSKAGVFENINFSIKQGEILGFAGLMGAGRTEIVRAIFGLDAKDSGNIYINNNEVIIKNVEDAISNGICMLSEDRRRYGLITPRNMKENMGLVALKHLFNKAWLDQKREKMSILEMMKQLNVKPPDMELIVENLSGGNQQKVVLGKWLLLNPKVLILDEPTRGIDVGAKHEIYKLMRKLTADGVAVLMISSELPELLGMSDRIMVIQNGKIAGELTKAEATSIKIMHLATGGKNE